MSNVSTSTKSETWARKLTPEDLHTFQSKLLRWFDSHHREMPWRHTGNPYDVLVSEIMLQQTRVSTVVDYFERWMVRFPRLEDLASASEEEVLELWSGLGYYSRARNLRKAAIKVVDEYQGEIPRQIKALRSLPGVGPYTAGAIASIAFGLPEPLVDGNVNRVLTRIATIDGDPAKSPAKTQIWAKAAELVPLDRPGDFNQALMELGREVCRPTAADCGNCPIAQFCHAHKIDEVDRFPELAKRKKPREMRGVSIILRSQREGDSYFLLRRRSPQGLLAGLWEFPSIEQEGKTYPAYTELITTLPESLGYIDRIDEERPPRPPLQVEHLFSHRRLRLRVIETRIDRNLGALPPHYQWVSTEDLETGHLAASALLRKIWQARKTPPFL